jgi:hypothetical protein
VSRIHNATVKALEDPSVKRKLADVGAELMIMAPEDFDQRIARETAVAVKLATGRGYLGSLVCLKARRGRRSSQLPFSSQWYACCFREQVSERRALIIGGLLAGLFAGHLPRVISWNIVSE